MDNNNIRLIYQQPNTKQADMAMVASNRNNLTLRTNFYYQIDNNNNINGKFVQLNSNKNENNIEIWNNSQVCFEQQQQQQQH